MYNDLLKSRSSKINRTYDIWIYLMKTNPEKYKVIWSKGTYKTYISRRYSKQHSGTVWCPVDELTLKWK